MLDAPAPIPDNALDLTPLPTGFLDDFANILGNAGTHTDGFDSMLLAVVNDMATVPDLMTSLDPDLVDVGTASGDLAQPWEQDFSSSLASAISEGDPDFQKYNVDLTSGVTPPPPGTGPGASANCYFLDWGTVVDLSNNSVNQIPKTIYLQNTGTVDLKVLSHAFSPDLGLTFSIAGNLDGAVIHPGQSLPLTIIAQSGQAFDATSTLTLVTDAPDPQPCLTCHCNFISGVYSPPIHCPLLTIVDTGGPRPPVKPECA